MQIQLRPNNGQTKTQTHRQTYQHTTPNQQLAKKTIKVGKEPSAPTECISSTKQPNMQKFNSNIQTQPRKHNQAQNSDQKQAQNSNTPNKHPTPLNPN